MIIRMDFLDIGVVGIVTTFKEKMKNHYIRFKVDEYSLNSALKKTKNLKWVVALDYIGDVEYLKTLDIGDYSKPIVITKNMDEVTELGVRKELKKVPNWVRLVIKTPPNFNDMQLVKDLSTKYKNLSFCNGSFLRLDGCNIGCIQRDDIPKRISEGKINYYTKGCNCIIKTFEIREVENYELLYDDVKNKIDEIKENKGKSKNVNTDNKRVLKDLRDLL